MTPNPARSEVPAALPVIEKPQEARPFRFAQVHRDMAFLDRLGFEEAKTLFAMLCRLPISRNLGEIAEFVDLIWFLGRNAEFRTGFHRVKGAEMDTFRDRLDAAVREILEVTRDLAHRAGLTDQVLRHRGLLVRNGLVLPLPEPSRKYGRPSGAAGKKSEGPAPK